MQVIMPECERWFTLSTVHDRTLMQAPYSLWTVCFSNCGMVAHLELCSVSFYSLSCFLSGGHVILQPCSQQFDLVLSSRQSCLPLPELLILCLQECSAGQDMQACQLSGQT